MVNITYKNEAVKQLRRIGPADLKKTKKKILSLTSNPLSGKPLSGEFEGKRSLKAWPLRILYTFNPKTQTIIIETIDYRGQVYK